MGTLSTPRLALRALGSAEKCLEMGETQFLLFIGTFEKCLEMGETQFLLFIGTFQKCPEMGENVFSYLQALFKSVQKWEKTFSPISRHFLSFLLFLDTFSLILDTKVSRNGRKWIFIFSHFQTLFVVSPVSRHLFSYFRPKSVQKWEMLKNVIHAGPEQPFRCLDGLLIAGWQDLVCQWQLQKFLKH